MVKDVRLYAVLALILALCGCRGQGDEPGKGDPQQQVAASREEQRSQPPLTQSVEAIAQTVCKEVGEVSNASLGTHGAPVIVLEEHHDSRVGQIQHAIALVRLHEHYGLRPIALEGYLAESGPINTDWWNKATRGLSVTERARVPVRLLKEGEISSAEFMKLVYDDVVLQAIETTSEYNVELAGDAAIAPFTYLLKIALASLGEEHLRKVKQFQAEIARAKGNTQVQAKKREEMQEYIFSNNTDPWVQEKFNKDPGTLTAEEHLAHVEEIAKHASENAIALQPAEKSAMERNLAFWRGRIGASKTMADRTGNAADQPNVSVVAMIIGSAHTAGVRGLLTSSGRGHAVVTPLALKNKDERGDLSLEMFERKYQRLSVYSEGYKKTLLEALPPLPAGRKKPEPVLREPWFQADAQLSTSVVRIVDRVFGPSSGAGGGKPPSVVGGGQPPFGFSEDDFRFDLVFINPKDLQIVPLDPQRPETGSAVLIPVSLNPNDRIKHKPIWVKATRGAEDVASSERESVEAMLKRALKEVLSEQPAGRQVEGVQPERQPRKKAEDKAGRIQITVDTVAIFGTSEQEVRKAALRGI
jgi:hypothetical protein